MTALVGKWHLGPEGHGPERHGFDFNIGGGPEPGPASYFPPYNLSKLPDGPPGEYLTDRLTEEAVGFIRANRDRPFFLYFSHYAVHSAIGPRPMAPNRTAKAGFVEYFSAKADPAAPAQNPTYAAMIRSLDESVGRVLEALEEESLTEGTIIIFTSDNGGVELSRGEVVTSNLPLRDGKGTFYEGGIRVPTLISWIGVLPSGKLSEVPAVSIDLYPTILELAGLEKNPGQILDGVSLVPVLKGRETLERNALYFHFPHVQGAAKGLQHFLRENSSAVRVGDLKLIHSWETGDELYDLSKDIGESEDLAERMPAETARLRGMLFDWLERVGAQVPTKNPGYRTPGPEGWWASDGLSLDAGSLVVSAKAPGVLLSPLIARNRPHEVGFRMRSSAEPCGPASLGWQDNRPSPRLPKVHSIDFEAICDDRWHEYEIRLRGSRGIRRFWLDLPRNLNSTRFDWIRLQRLRSKDVGVSTKPVIPPVLEWNFDGG